MKPASKLLSFLLITAMVIALLPVVPVSAAGYNLNDSGYTTIGHLPNDYVASQGMAADGNYVYSLKTPSGGHNNAIIYRTDIHTGNTIALVNADNTSTYDLNGLGHGNDMAAVVHNGKTYLYVTTMYHVGHEEYSAHTLWKLEVSGNTVRRVAYYDVVNESNDPINFVNLSVHSFENGTVRLLGCINTMVFSMDIGINQGSGTVKYKYICPLNYNSITVPTGSPGFSGAFGVQGMTYNNGYLYFVMSGSGNSSYSNRNFIIAYDLSNLADGSLRNNVQAETIHLTSDYYWFFLEVESIDAVNGRMYFTANAGSSGGYYYNEDFVGCFNQIYDTDPNGMMLNFDSGSRETKWNWRHYISTSGASISPNPNAGGGYLSGTLGALTSEGMTSTDSYIRMTAFDVLYKIKAGDIVEIGFDYEHISGTAPNSAAVFFTTNKVGYFTPDRMFAGNSHYFRNGRNILQFALSGTSGGAVGEFIGQLRIDLFDGGSNDFKAKYAIDYIYIGQPQNSPQNKLDYLGNGDFVYMDFVPSSPMSANNNWSGNSISALVNHSNGTLNGDIFGGDPFLCTEGMPGMKIKSGDIIEVRIKTTITAGNAGHIEIFYGTDKAPGYSGDRTFALPIYATGEYQVAYAQLPANVVGHTLTNIRIDPVSAGGNEPLKGSYTIDYIYAGRPNNSPKNKLDHMGGGRFLMIDFDKEAPLCETGDWATNSCVVTGDTAAGLLKGTYKGGDPYAVSRGSILYTIEKGDVVEIRMKSNVTSGTARDQMEFFFVTLQKPQYGASGYLTEIFSHNNSFQTIRMTIPESFAGQTVSGIRIDPLANGAGDALGGSFEIDYIYMGPKEQAPASIYTVSFYDDGGKLLQSVSVSEGENVSYPGKTPTKASDEQKHYTFLGWVDDKGNAANLNGIKSDMKVYASFKGEGHNYTSKVTKEPTCSATGIELFSCACGKSFEDVLPKTDHRTELKNAVAATCSKEGYTGDYVCKDCGTVTKKGTTIPKTDHNTELKNVVAATCSKEGYTGDYVCKDCGTVTKKGTTVPKTSHNIVTDKGYAATCTAVGKTDGSHCSICNEVIEAQQDIPMLPHTPKTLAGRPSDCMNYGLSDGTVCGVCGKVLSQQTELPLGDHTPVTVPGSPASCTGSGLSDGEKCGVCGVTLVEQTVLPRLGHSYTVYEDQGDTHIVHCERCDKTVTEEHSYTDGTCVCGRTEKENVNVDESVVIRHSLNLAGDISVNYVVDVASLSAYDLVVLECRIPVYEGNSRVGEKMLSIMPILKGNYYYFVLDGLTAVQMNDTVIAQLRMMAGEKEYVSVEDSYSIATYAYSQLRKENASHSLKVLCADLLQYGGAAQAYKGYRTDAPADEEMSLVEVMLMSDLGAVTFGNTNQTGTVTAGTTVLWAGKALDLTAKVGIKYIVDLSGFNGDPKALSLHLSYTDIEGKKQTAVVTEMEAYRVSDGLYSFTFDGLKAAELRAVVEATVYNGNAPVSPVLRYSPDTYGNGKTGSLLTLCQALFAYVDSAKAFFHVG